MKLINYTALVACFFTYTTCANSTIQYSPLHYDKKQPETWLTIFIHGAIKPQFCTSDLMKVMRDHVEDSSYEKAVAAVRNDPFFYHHHAMQELGLKPIDITIHKKNSGSHAVANIYDTIIETTQDKETTNHYYTFGWSGLLSNKTRYSDSTLLYNSLVKELQHFHRKGIFPKIRIIAYSHGGNVTLYLARVKKEKQCNVCLMINETIFIGMPVIRETDFYVSDSMFQRVYHIYSPEDKIQNHDFFSFKRFFSHRRFHSRRDFKLPNTLTQIKLKVFRYTPRKPYRDNPEILDKITYQDYPRHKVKRIPCSPGHTELWYLGWTLKYYRKEFPLFPLPIAVTTPLITQHIRQTFPHKNQSFVELELHPQRNMMQLRKRQSAKKHISTFIPADNFKTLQKKAIKFKPDESLKEEAKRRIKMAKVQASAKYYKPEKQHHGKRGQKLGVCFTLDEVPNL